MNAASGRSTLHLQVRYSETDAMGFVYYAHYLVYFEVARTAALAELGHPYWEMEKAGIFIPVLCAHCDYRKPARYGEDLAVHTLRSRRGHARIRFDYEVRGSADALIAAGFTEHAFMDKSGKPMRPPAPLTALFPPAAP